MENINWQRKIINRLYPKNFKSDIENIKEAFQNVCKDFEEYEEIEVDIENLSLTIKSPYNTKGVSYIVCVYDKKIELNISTIYNTYNPIGRYNLDNLNKGYYDFDIEQREHKYLTETINYEEIINKLMEYAVEKY